MHVYIVRHTHQGHVIIRQQAANAGRVGWRNGLVGMSKCVSLMTRVDEMLTRSGVLNP